MRNEQAVWIFCGWLFLLFHYNIGQHRSLHLIVVCASASLRSGSTCLDLLNFPLTSWTSSSRNFIRACDKITNLQTSVCFCAGSYRPSAPCAVHGALNLCVLAAWSPCCLPWGRCCYDVNHMARRAWSDMVTVLQNPWQSLIQEEAYSTLLPSPSRLWTNAGG